MIAYKIKRIKKYQYHLIENKTRFIQSLWATHQTVAESIW